jgi:hypothetical protein
MSGRYDIHPGGHATMRVFTQSEVTALLRKERERCAKVADKYAIDLRWGMNTAGHIGVAIRQLPEEEN